MTRMLSIAIAVTLSASAMAPAAHATNGINALIAVSQLKAQNANDEAERGNETPKGPSGGVSGKAQKPLKGVTIKQ